MTSHSDAPVLYASLKAYREWRARKLSEYPVSIQELIVPVTDLTRVSAAERTAIQGACQRANLAIFTSPSTTAGKADIRLFGEQCGLIRLDNNLYADEDGITALQVSEVNRKRDYIPYTNRRLNWHTDGYYNPPGQHIQGFLMFCVRDAGAGGENYLLDHEIAYILLRDADPRFIEALMHPQAMSIPANIEAGMEIRPTATGPVFFHTAGTANLQMRYSARTRNILWRDDALTRAAVEYLQTLWTEGSPYIYYHRLMPGQGLICNNILHSRSAFKDDPANGRNRLMYRARYYDRVHAADHPASSGAQVTI